MAWRQKTRDELQKFPQIEYFWYFEKLDPSGFVPMRLIIQVIFRILNFRSHLFYYRSTKHPVTVLVLVMQATFEKRWICRMIKNIFRSAAACKKKSGLEDRCLDLKGKCNQKEQRTVNESLVYAAIFGFSLSIENARKDRWSGGWESWRPWSWSWLWIELINMLWPETSLHPY